MDIADAVTRDFVSVGPSTPVSKLRGTFETNDRTRVVVVEADGEVLGVVSRKELLGSHHPPEEKVWSVMRSPPRVDRREDVRETARLMVESELKLLPVFESDRFCGVVTDRTLLELVEPHLDALDVADVYTRDLVSVGADASLGQVINAILEHSISRVPVLDGDDPVGIVSIHDLVDFTVRQMDREQGGAPPGFDGHGGAGSHSGYRSRRGFGERAGDSARMLDLPVRDVMSTPVETVTPDTSLETTVHRLLGNQYSSLLVAGEGTSTPAGIVTTTDVLQALTVTEDDRMDVQLFGVDLLDTLSREDVASRIEEIDDKYAEMDVLEANVIFQAHKEQQRGTPLILATIRLFTDQGRFSGTAEEYGSRTAFSRAADVLEENVLEDKERKQPTQKSERSRERSRKLLGWWLGTA